MPLAPERFFSPSFWDIILPFVALTLVFILPSAVAFWVIFNVLRHKNENNKT